MANAEPKAAKMIENRSSKGDNKVSKKINKKEMTNDLPDRHLEQNALLEEQVQLTIILNGTHQNQELKRIVLHRKKNYSI